MERKEIVAIIEKEKVVVIIRLTDQNEVPDAIRNLILGGIKVIEITSNTPGYLEEIKKARQKYPNIVIGAGTVSDIAIAKQAIQAGAQFLVTPNTDEEVVTEAHLFDIPVLMGALTPTEISLAIKYGADFIKLFPAGNFGVSYFKAITGPFDKAKFFAVGGIDLSNIKEWLDAGIKGVGIGGVLVKSLKNGGDSKHIIETSQQIVQLVK